MATGVLNLLYVLVLHSRQLAAIAQDGFLDTMELNPAQFDRKTAYWHRTFGAILVPVSGFRLVLAQAVMMLMVARRGTTMKAGRPMRTERWAGGRPMRSGEKSTRGIPAAR